MLLNRSRVSCPYPMLYADGLCYPLQLLPPHWVSDGSVDALTPGFGIWLSPLSHCRVGSALGDPMALYKNEQGCGIDRTKVAPWRYTLKMKWPEKKLVDATALSSSILVDPNEQLPDKWGLGVFSKMQ